MQNHCPIPLISLKLPAYTLRYSDRINSVTESPAWSIAHAGVCGWRQPEPRRIVGQTGRILVDLDDNKELYPALL